MSRARTRRPGTRSGQRAPAPHDFPDDLPSAAVAALDDLLAGAGGAAGPTRRATSQPAVAVEEADVVVEEERSPELPALRVGVLEADGQLAAAQGAVVAAGHVLVAGGAGPQGVARVTEALQRGKLDALIAGLGAPGEASAPAARLITSALVLEPHRPVVIAAVAGEAVAAVQRAAGLGADLVTVRPHDAGRLAQVLLAAGRLHAARTATISARGSEQVLRARLDEIAGADPRGLQPFEVFQRALELEIRRARRYEYALSVALFAVEIAPPPPPPGIRGILRARAGTALIHAIRDIDLATQLDHERFLVLLPYTDLTGAAGLARRVIATVASGDPVVSGGRTFPPRLVGAVAGARPDQPLSFAKLMKDASRALDQARRDGAELAVQP